MQYSTCIFLMKYLILIFQTNPPFFAPLVELIPSPWTDPDVVPKAKGIMEKLGQVPVILKKEIEGFVLNRIQYSILKESWRLIKVRISMPVNT